MQTNYQEGVVTTIIVVWGKLCQGVGLFEQIKFLPLKFQDWDNPVQPHFVFP